jgi:hypothetical protein
MNIKKRIFITSVLLCLCSSANILPNDSSEPISKKLILRYVNGKYRKANFAIKNDPEENKQYWRTRSLNFFLLNQCLKKVEKITPESVINCFHQCADFLDDQTHTEIEASLTKKIDKLKAASHEENNSF